mgnify:CR=1 FL=1|jgi:Beta-lactamase class C and other penicillin binding proteins
MNIRRFNSWRMVACTVFGVMSCQQEEIPLPDYSPCSARYTNHPQHQQYSQLLHTYQEQTAAPGSIVGVKQIGQAPWVGAAGYSNLAHQSAMDACTPFRIGSVTKLFTATVVLKLAEAGLLGLDDKITTHLPGLRGQLPRADEITIRQLLNHTSGLGHPTDDDINYQLGLINNPGYFADLTTRQRLQQFIYGKPLKHLPGSSTYYSNAGYWVLEWMVEAATDKPFAENLQEQVFVPLGLVDTYLARRADPNVARGYNRSGNRIYDVTRWDAADGDGDPAAGIISTAADLLTFGQALFDGRLLSAPSLEAMTTIAEAPGCDDCGYGLGIELWKVGPFSGYGMNGSSLGVDANLIYFPDRQMAVVLFSNYGGGNRKDVIEDLLHVTD